MQETKKYLKEFYSFSTFRLVFRKLLHIHFGVVSIFVDPETSFSFQRCASHCGGRGCLGGGACTPPTLNSPLTHLPDFSSLTEGLGCTHTHSHIHTAHTLTHTQMVLQPKGSHSLFCPLTGPANVFLSQITPFLQKK